jgi:hypothetical protein
VNEANDERSTLMRRLWVGVLVVVALSGAGIADRFSKAVPPTPAADRPAEPGGVWVCPVVKVGGAAGYIHLVNTGAQRATVHVTYVPDGRKPLEQALTIASRHAVTVGSPSSIAAQAAGAIVEYAGGDVTVSRTVLMGGIGIVPRGAGAGGLSAGAASCARPGGVLQVVPQGSTLRSETQLVILNPGTADAVVDIALVSNGQEVRPVSLQGRVVPARRRLVIREGDYAFDARAVGAVITADAGRIVADALVIAPGIADLIPGMNATHDLVTLASSARGAAAFSTVAVGEEDAVIEAYVLSAEGRTAYTALATGLAPNAPQVAAAPTDGVPPGAVALIATSKTSAIAIGSRWGVKSSTGKIDSAVSSGVLPSNQVIAVVGPPATTSALRLLIANPDAIEGLLDVLVITESGATAPARLQNIHLGPGRTATLVFPNLAGNATVGVLVTSTGARIAAALEAIAAPTNSFAAYAVTGVPVLAAPPVAVEPDARQGVPAS